MISLSFRYVAGHAVGFDGVQKVLAKGPPSCWHTLFSSQISGESYSTETIRRVDPLQLGPLFSSRKALCMMMPCELTCAGKTEAMNPLTVVGPETTEPPASQMNVAEPSASSWYCIVELAGRPVSFQVAIRSATLLPRVTTDAVAREKLAEPAFAANGKVTIIIKLNALSRTFIDWAVESLWEKLNANLRTCLGLMEIIAPAKRNGVPRVLPTFGYPLNTVISHVMSQEDIKKIKELNISRLFINTEINCPLEPSKIARSTYRIGS